MSMQRISPKDLFLFGFYGAGSQQTYGNIWLQQLVMQLEDQANVPAQLFEHNGSKSAIRALLAALDHDGSRIITPEKLAGVQIGVVGYSWGGVGAIGFTQRLSQPGEIVVGGSPRQPISYRLEMPVPIAVLFTIDPVPFLNPPGTVQKNVNLFANVIQRRGGKSVFIPSDGGAGEIQIGNWLSERLMGTGVPSKAKVTIQFDARDLGIYRCGYPFAMMGDFREYCIGGQDCGHDGLPWLATPQAFEAFKGNVAALRKFKTLKRTGKRATHAKTQV